MRRQRALAADVARFVAASPVRYHLASRATSLKRGSVGRLGESHVSDVKTRPAHSQDLNFLAEVFLTSMRNAITAARGYWDFGKEDAQFRQQLDLSATHVIQVDNRDVGFIMTRRLGDRVVEVHTLCVNVDQQGTGLGALIMGQLMQNVRSTESSLELSVLKANS